MKTINDVIAAYPDGWPSDCDCCFTTAPNWDSDPTYIGTFKFANEGGDVFDGYQLCLDNNTSWVLLCTREEYEQALKEKIELDAAVDRLAKLADKPSDWYDYENQIAISLPPTGVECEVNHDNKWHKTFIVGRSKRGTAVYECNKFDDTHVFDGNSSAFMFRPLDHDKHQAKTVSLDWLVDSGIDCEFSDDGEKWYISKLSNITDSEYGYKNSNAHTWKRCRPRQNHPMVLTDEQVKLIPDGFVCELYPAGMGLSIVTFKGLKEGYKYEWES